MIRFKQSKPRGGKAEPPGRAVRGLAAGLAAALRGGFSRLTGPARGPVQPARRRWWRWW
jgi:hypothetical protein